MIIQNHIVVVQDYQLLMYPMIQLIFLGIHLMTIEELLSIEYTEGPIFITTSMPQQLQQMLF